MSVTSEKSILSRSDIAVITHNLIVRLPEKYLMWEIVPILREVERMILKIYCKTNLNYVKQNDRKCCL